MRNNNILNLEEKKEIEDITKEPNKKIEMGCRPINEFFIELEKKPAKK